MNRESCTKIIVRDLKLDMRIGVHEREKKRNQSIIVNIEIELQPVTAGQTDNIRDTLDYETVINDVRSIAQTGHVHLVEHFAEKIAAVCLRHEKAAATTVRVEKPAAFKDITVGVEIKRTRI